MALAASFAAAPSARAQSCTSSDPSQWPAPSKPYFLVVVDTSGSMGNTVPTGTNSCGYQHNRIGDARCAVKKTIQAFSGEVNFGLATYAWQLNCPANAGACATCNQTSGCFTNTGCSYNYTPTDNNSCGPLTTDNNLTASLNGTFPNTKTIHAGGLIQVPVTQDNYWNPPLNPSNFQSIFNLVDDGCGNGEIGAASNTPLGGVLFNMNQYFSGTYHDPFTNAAIPSPIGPATFNGNAAERLCRSVNVILITDGDETCDDYNLTAYPSREGLAVFEAGRLFNPGVTVGTLNFAIKTYVIGFIGATTAALDHIANAGGTTSSYSANNETQLSQALANIVGGSIKPETCNNTDDNCNGCVDEGFAHYCNTNPTCCAWTSQTARTTCINNYLASVTPANPQGNRALLPCTTVAQSQASASWLCYDPGDVCDNNGNDDNCNGVPDEGAVKCGSPLHCPTAEVCDGKDNDCNGLIDEGNVCQNNCAVTPSAEVCDGCDNDCNGLTDDGINNPPVPCGFTGPGEPAYCAGTITCKPPVSVPNGTCSPNGGFTACTFPAPGPKAETCNNLDDDCNGIVDDNIPATPCEPAGTPPGLSYGANSQCKMGTTQCINGMTQCVGWVGPSAEVCDGIDNNCDGSVDNNVTGVGQPCGKNQPPCTPGTLACVNGALVCSGGVQPTPEICDGKDNDCNGMIDDGALADAPAPGMNGCWDLPGPCCKFPAVNPVLQWCPPPGGSCNDNGTLAAPCNHGSLSCVGGAWQCKNSKDPSPEVCDGVDNDCNGTPDDGVMNVGTPCGIDQGECKQGMLTCTGGVLTCQGGVFPTQETCDGKDNDCDGVVDNGIPIGGPCTVPYDMTAFPGPRDNPPCKPGHYQCDGNGNLVCVGGVGPQAEVCDGVDNDCDGVVDEVGAAPNGINGSPNPFPPPNANIGDVCGVNQGECKEGAYACVNGQFGCLGGQGPTVEVCDCLDNDCDGTIDNPNPNNNPPLCGSGSDCIKSSFGCGCATPCDLTKEFPCPGGQVCQDVTDAMGNPKGKYCVSDPCGGDCKGKTITDANNKVVCAPPGTPPDPATCVAPPVCVCKGQNGCKNPCAGVSCATGSICTEYGPNAGKCVVDNCFSNPCQGCGKVCNLGACVQNPCDPNPCPADQECKPSADFTSFACVLTCAGMTCPSGQACDQGKCQPDCAQPCPSGQVCDTTQSPPMCVGDKCNPNPCTDGSFCDPATGACGNDPCAGVVCPQGQECKHGSCFKGQSGTGGGATTSSSSSTSTSTSGGGNGGHGGGNAPSGVWGLATGGGGCGCEVGVGAAERLADARLALVALGLILGVRRRAKPARRAGEEVSR